jgi:tetratricopeptide (TPR) repeat protein
MNTPRGFFRTILRVAAPGVLTLIAGTGGTAYGGASDAPDGSASLRESFRQALVTAPSLPPGAEPSYRPLNQSTISLPRLETDPAKAEQRARDLNADLRTIVPVEPLPAAGTTEFLKLRADALAIVQRSYQESRDRLEPDAVGEFDRRIPWTPDFSAAPRTISPADRERAAQASYSVAFAITHLDRPRFVVAYAGAMLALNPDGTLEAENAASAIATSAERLYGAAASAAQLAAARDDAAVVYRYALACSVVDDKWTLRSLGILINLGNLYVDMKSPERARPVLLAARAFAPNSWEAALALGSCYMLQGRPELARAALEAKSVKPSAIFAAATKGGAQLEAISSSGDLSPDSAEEEFEDALKTFEGKETLTAADFVAAIDPSERDRMRRFVDTLPVQGSYRTPEINGLTQFSTLKSISTPAGFRALGDFHERLGAHYMPLLGHMVQGQTEFLARLGLNVKFNVDINDVMAHPERYKDANINVTVTGVEELKARVGAMKSQAEQMKAALESGNMAAILQPSPMALTASPGLAIHLLKPFDYANPMDVMMQQYNISVLAQKIHAYNTSFFATNRRTRAALEEIVERHAKNRAEIRAMEELETALFQKRKAEAAKSGDDIHNARWRLLEHNLHQRFMNEYNARAEFEWKEATQVAAKAYADKIKPRAERFYYDVFRHIALISDPEVREKKNRDFEQMLIFGVSQGLENVLGAFGSMPYVQEWDCHCNLGSLLADAEREEKELEQIREEREAREQQARLRFESGEIPPSSPLFQKLDAYGADLNIPFIPLLSGRISCACSTFTLAAELPTALSPKGTYTFTESAFTGATTHAAGLEISVSAEDGSLSAAATLNVRGSVSLDGQGTVTDYSVTGASTVNVGLGPVSGTIAAEVGYTSSGGLTTDVSGGLTAVLDGEYGRSTQVTIEGSARRGSTLSVQAEQNLNPYSGEIDSFLRDISQESVGDKFPFSTGLKKEVWNGRFAL